MTVADRLTEFRRRWHFSTSPQGWTVTCKRCSWRCWIDRSTWSPTSIVQLLEHAEVDDDCRPSPPVKS